MVYSQIFLTTAAKRSTIQGELVKNLLCKITGLISALGAINWGLVGLLKFNLVDQLFGTMPQVASVVYIIIGLSGAIFLGLSLLDSK